MDLISINIGVVLNLVGFLELPLVILEFHLDSSGHDNVLVLAETGNSVLSAEHLSAALEVLGGVVTQLKDGIWALSLDMLEVNLTVMADICLFWRLVACLVFLLLALDPFLELLEVRDL